MNSSQPLSNSDIREYEISLITMKKKPPIPTLNFNSENNRKLQMNKSATNLSSVVNNNSHFNSKADLSQSF